jgi:hypothetical protein
MDLAVRASIFKWFSMRVKQVEVKREEEIKENWSWSVPSSLEPKRSSRLKKKK